LAEVERVTTTARNPMGFEIRILTNAPAMAVYRAAGGVEEARPSTMLTFDLSNLPEWGHSA
jgi:hypothetical protein